MDSSIDSSMDSSMEPSMEPPDPVPSSSQKSGIAPEAMLADAIARGAFHATTRRGFLAAGGMAAAALALVGCTPTRNTALPGGRWASTDDLPPGGMQECPAPAPPVPNPAGRDVATILAGGGPAALPYAKPRRFWARGEPELSVLNPMLPVHAITVHHDGLDILETSTAERAMMARLELYRVGHRAKGWGDIGYHLVIDRAGELWQGSSIRWQGAHVKDHNEGNIGGARDGELRAAATNCGASQDARENPRRFDVDLSRSQRFGVHPPRVAKREDGVPRSKSANEHD